MRPLERAKHTPKTASRNPETPETQERKQRQVLALALLGKMLYPLHPLIAVAGWSLWLMAAYKENSRWPGLFAYSAWAGALNAVSLLLFLAGLRAGGLQLSENNVLEYAGAYLVGLLAAFLYARSLSRIIGRPAYLWLLGSLIYPLGFPLHFGVRLWTVYRLAVGRNQDKPRDHSVPQAVQEGHDSNLTQQADPPAQAEQAQTQPQHDPLPPGHS